MVQMADQQGKSEMNHGLSPAQGVAAAKNARGPIPSLEELQSPVQRFAWSIWTRFWRGLLHLRFRLLQQHRHNRVVVEQIAGKSILVLPQVMNPALFITGSYLAGLLSPSLFTAGSGICRKPPESVLDMGCGSGICAIFAAEIAQRVVAVDLNPAAVRCTRINVLLHHLEERVEVREGDLFNSVQGQQFDLIVFNPPYLHGQPASEFERALWSVDVIERFAAGLGVHLTADGVALVLLSSIADHGKHLEHFLAQGFRVDVVARRYVLTEALTVYQLCPE
jgi:release factor glutamine methyltransferase